MSDCCCDGSCESAAKEVKGKVETVKVFGSG